MNTAPVQKTLHAKLAEIKLDTKLIEIALSKGGVPTSLRDDVSQEINIAWLAPIVNESLSEGEIASYAYRIAITTALRVRRDFGGPVRLPGSAFRKRKDGSTYVQPGHLAAPLQWEEMSDTLMLNDAEALNLYEDTPWGDLAHTLSLESPNPETMTDEERYLREVLTDKQLEILRLLCAGVTFPKIELMMDMQRSALQRNLRIIKKKMIEFRK